MKMAFQCGGRQSNVAFSSLIGILGFDHGFPRLHASTVLDLNTNCVAARKRSVILRSTVTSFDCMLTS